MEDKRISEYDNLAAADIEDTDLLEVGRPSIKNFKLTWANLRLAVITFLSDILLGKEDVSNKKTDLTDNSDTFYVSQKAVKTAIDSVNTAIDSKQDKLVSGTNIKTINSNTLLGSGNIEIEVPEYFDDLSDIPAHPGVADKILNTKSSGYEWVDKPSVNFGGTGVDGALSISSGTTTLNLGGASIFVKNYTTIDITGTGKLTFSNPNANGTIVILKATGNVTLTSSTVPLIDVSNLGGAGGAKATGKDSLVTSSPGKGYCGSGGLRCIGYNVSRHGGSGGNLNAGSGGYLVSIYGTPEYENYAFSSPNGAIGAMLPPINYSDLPLPGGGGAGGIAENAGYSSNGGNGGGGLLIECYGAWNFTGTIWAKGQDSADTTDHKGRGGGGAGGSVKILYNTLTANTGTIVVTGGSAGEGNAGSVGQSLVEAFYD